LSSFIGGISGRSPPAYLAIAYILEGKESQAEKAKGVRRKAKEIGGRHRGKKEIKKGSGAKD
jgi:hypothetical protein